MYNTSEIQSILVQDCLLKKELSEVEPAPSVSSSLLPSSSSSTAPKCTTNKLKIAEQVPSVPKCTNKQTNDS